MTSPDLLKSDILQFIAQRSPIVMVDKIVNIENEVGTTSFVIRPDNVFVSNGRLQEPGMIENIAQSAAAMTGYKAITEKTKVKRGFIGSVKKLEIIQLPEAGKKIKTTINVVTEVMNASVIEGKIYLDELLIASCQLNIFLEE